MSFKAQVEPMASPAKKPKVQSASDSIIQEVRGAPLCAGLGRPMGPAARLIPSSSFPKSGGLQPFAERVGMGGLACRLASVRPHHCWGAGQLGGGVATDMLPPC